MPEISESICYQIERQKLAAYRSWHPGYKMQDLTVSPVYVEASFTGGLKGEVELSTNLRAVGAGSA